MPVYLVVGDQHQFKLAFGRKIKLVNVDLDVAVQQLLKLCWKRVREGKKPGGHLDFLGLVFLHSHRPISLQPDINCQGLAWEEVWRPRLVLQG